MKRILNLGSLSRIVEGDPNEITANEILVIRDKDDVTKVDDIQIRGNDGQLVSILADKSKVLFSIVPTPADAVVTINNAVGTSAYINKGDAARWKVEATGYTMQSGVNNNITSNTAIAVTLERIVS